MGRTRTADEKFVIASERPWRARALAGGAPGRRLSAHALDESMTNSTAWPSLDHQHFADTLRSLQLWLQIAGKIRLARTPWLNHSWHVPLYVTVDGLGTGLVADGERSFTLDFDLCRHRFELATTDGVRDGFDLAPMPVADFHRRVEGLLARASIDIDYHGAPNELDDATPFANDDRPRPYDRDYAHALWQALVRIDRVLSRFRTGFLGKASPVHFFWGAPDLAVTRFSGRAAPEHPGGVPNLPDAITREAYSHEVSSAGFWPGTTGVAPLFYSYAYPEPDGFARQPVEPAAARYDSNLKEFVLAYDDVTLSRRSRRGVDGVPAVDLRCRGDHRQVGSRRARLRRRPRRRAPTPRLNRTIAMPHILAIDQGTTGTTALVLDEHLAVLGRGYREFAQHYPRPGLVEHDAEELWQSVEQAVSAALADAAVTDVQSIGITNQRETALLWQRADGRPVHRAIVWQDRRTAEACGALIADGSQDRVRSLTGLPIDPYFSATKVAWMLDQGDLRARADRGELAFGTVDSFLVHRLTGGKGHRTDVTNASRTLLFDIHAMAWSQELLRIFRVPESVLPEVTPSCGEFGRTAGLAMLPDGIPITGIAGDQQAALFGQACFEAGEAKCTFGTGAFLLMNTGDRAVPSTHGLVTTVAWQIPGELAYALEGSAFVAGAAVQWLRDGLDILDRSADVEALARSVPDSGGVVVVPAFAGLGAPHWRPDARGTITGLTRGTTRAHLARATLEGIALQNVDILRAMEQDAGQRLPTLKVDGGAAANDLLMQFQSDVLGVPISRPKLLETTALGAAMLAGLGAGVWPSRAELRSTWNEDRRFAPEMAAPRVEAHLARWRAAVAKA